MYKYIISSVIGLLALGGMVYAQTPGGVTVPQGGTGFTAVPSGALIVGDTSLRLGATSSPTVGYLTATSSTATSIFNGNVQINGTLNIPGTGTTTINKLQANYLEVPTYGYTYAGFIAPRFIATSTTVSSTFPYASTTAIGSSGSAYFATSGGNVGIGTTTPWGRLSVTGSGATSATYGLVVSDSANSPKMVVRDDGNIGIGTTSPVAMLSVRSTGTTDLLNLVETGGTEVFTVLESGNVGIGEATPVAKLDVIGGTVITKLSDFNTNLTARYRFADPAIGLGIGLAWTADRPFLQAYGMGGSNTATELLLNPYGGNVGIGTTSPFGKLSVAVGAANTTNIVNIATSTANVPIFNIDPDGVLNTKYGIYCEIYNSDNAVAQAIANGTTYVKSTALASTTMYESKYCNADPTNSQIVITKAGKYRVQGSFAFYATTNNVVVRGVAFADGIEQDNIHFMRKLGTASDIGSVSFTGFITATSSTSVDLRLRHDQGSPENITIEYGNMNVEYISN